VTLPNFLLIGAGKSGTTSSTTSSSSTPKVSWRLFLGEGKEGSESS
jgi:hypothetical protein